MKTQLISLVMGLLLPLTALSASTNSEPEQLILTTSNKIMDIVRDATGYIDSDPGRFDREVEASIDPVVDIASFARGVMGHLASARYISSLPAAEQDAARKNITDFTGVLRDTLIGSYGKIFYKYAGSTFAIESSELQGKGDRAAVIQKVTDTHGQQYTIQYTLGNRKGQDWKILNIIVEGINLGQSYRAQFDAALDQYHGNVSDVITHWPQIMTGHEE